jgi:hypothetical protein
MRRPAKRTLSQLRKPPGCRPRRGSGKLRLQFGREQRFELTNVGAERVLPILIRRSKDQVLTQLLQRLDKKFFVSTHAKVIAHVTGETPASESRPTEDRGLRAGTCASSVPLHVNAVNY